MLINSIRGMVKSDGGRLPKCAADYFATRVAAAVPAELVVAVEPLLQQITALTIQIRRLDQEIEKLTGRYPEIHVLRTAPGVGPVIAAAYVLTLDGVDAVEHSRSAGAFQDYSLDAVNPGIPIRNVTFLRQATFTCAVYWSRQHTTSWDGSVRTRPCADGD